MKRLFISMMLFALLNSAFAQTEDLTVKTADELLRLGYNYAMGENGFREDMTKADECFRASAQKGNAEAMYLMSLSENISCDEALEWLNKAVEKNFLPAYNRLSTLYYIGKGNSYQNTCVEVNYEKAFHYAKIAAEGGDDEGQRLYGLYKLWGTGTTRDEDEGVKWLERSGLNNNKGAMMDLKRYYFDKYDYVKYSYWLKKAAENGIAEAQYEYGELIYSNEYGLPTMENEACKWVELAAKQGYVPAFSAVAWYYRTGKGGVEQNKDKAIAWCRQGINNYNDVNCMWMLSEILPQNDVERIALLKDASVAGHKNSLAEYAYLNVDRKIPDADPQWGLQVLESLAEEGVPRAMARYGCFLYDGEVVKRNKAKGYSLVCKAAEAGDFMGALYKRFIEVNK